MSKAEQKKASVVVDVNQPEFNNMDIRVGLMIKVWNHPNVDKLLCKEINVGEESGGVRYITLG